MLLLLLLPVAPAAAGNGDRAHPHRRGALVHVDGAFAVRVVSVDANAWRSPVLAGRGNRPPEGGRTAALVTLQATNRARSAGIPFVNGSLGAIAASGAAYSSLTASCGTVARDVASIDVVAPGATVTVRACWQVSTRDAGSLVLVYSPYDGSSKTYFALR